MDDLNVDLLNPISIPRMRYTDLNICQRTKLASVFSGKGNHLHAFFFGGANGLKDILRVATCAQTKKNIALVAERFEISRKNEIISIVITNARDVAGI